MKITCWFYPSHPKLSVTMLSAQKTCPLCSKSVTSERGLKRHYARAHPEQLNNIDSCKPVIVPGCRNISVECPLCEHSAKKRPDICKHFADVHGLSMKEEAHDFTCSADFLKWKQDVEKITKSLFVKVRGTAPLKCVRGKKDVYVCHRSGKCRGKTANRVRHPKSQGSQKLNAFCPARMKVVVTEGDRVFLNFLPTHVGHGCDAVHLRLSQSEKEMIAKKIETKRPMDEILQEIKDSPEPLGRLTLLTKQDLYNISRDSSVLTTVFSDDEITDWTDDPQRRGSVLLFKTYGSLLSEIPELQNEDFLLCLLNEKQKHLFNQADCVSLDYFEASLPSEYNLFYVACIIGKSATPIAFMISNRKDSIIFDICLRTIKSSIGAVTPQAVFHEKNSILFEAWKRVFNEPNVELLGSWQVELEWRRAVSKLVTSVHKKPEIYKNLKLLMEAPQESKFTELLNEITMKTLACGEIEEFGKYFRKQFLHCPSLWARCHRSPKTIETNAMFEKLFKTIKFVHIRYKMTKTVYKMSDLLLDIVRQCESGVFSKSVKLKCIRSHHRMAVDARLSVEQDDDSWKVTEPEGEYLQVQVVEKVDIISCRCRVRCSDCRCCVHEYKCTCSDFVSRKIMCKHIHAVCLSFVSSDDSMDAKFNPVQDSIISDSDLIVETVSTDNLEVIINDEVTGGSVEEGRLEIQEDFNTMLSLITTTEDVNLVKNAFRLILPTLYAMKSNNNMHPQLETAGEVSSTEFT